MITLRLQGSLAVCTRERLSEEDLRRSSADDAVLDLDARSVAEAIRLLAPQVPDFEWTLRKGAWRITVDGEPITLAELDVRLPDRAYVSIAPALVGETGVEIGVLGWILIGTSVALGVYAASQIPSIPDTDHLEHGERRSLFSGPVNSAAQGGAVPLIYGQTRVGSVVVSGGITQERPTGGDYTDPDPLDLGGERPPGFDRPRQDRGRDALRPNISTDAGDASEERSVMRVVDLLGEGEIEGLVDGLKSVYLDGVAVQDGDGNTDLEGVSVQERKGLAHGATGQEALTGFDSTSTVIRSNQVELTPNSRVIQNVQGYDAVRVTLYFPRLLEVHEKGNEIAAEVEFRIESRAGGSGAWTRVLTQTMRSLSLDEQEMSWRVERPSSVGPTGAWQVAVTRTSPAPSSARVSNAVHLRRIAGLRDVKQTYPHSAVIGLTIETDQIEVNPLRREYEVKGRKVLTPPNSVWNPNQKTATHQATYGAGIWDGSGMVRRWTNNPAWIAYDLLVDERAGLGDVPGMKAAAQAARAEFLALSKRCDELVPAPNSATDMEPRWRFNGVIQRREQARKVVDWVLSSCRAGVLWSEGAVALTIDGESDVTASIGNANVIAGEFEYQGLRWQERYSAVVVTWQDPDDGYQSGLELVVDHALVEKYGWREKQVAAVGCTSRGQAARVGWLILNEQERESETVKFRMALEGMHLRPGDRIRIADEARYGVRAAFRVLEVDTSTAGRETITLDGDAPRLLAGSGGRIVWGSNGSATVTRAAADRNDQLRTTDVPTRLLAGDLVLNAAADVDWIVTRLSERDELEVHVEASRYSSGKYAAVEERRQLAAPLVEPEAAILAPTAVVAREKTYEDKDQVRSLLEIAVRGGDDPRIDRVEYEIQRPKRPATATEIAAGDWTVLPRGPWQPLRVSTSRSIIVRDVPLGGYRVRARFIGRRRRSAWTLSAAFLVDGKTDPNNAPTGLKAVGVVNGYWLSWARSRDADYDYTEVWDRVGTPGSPTDDVNVEDGNWTLRGSVTGTEFRTVGITATDGLRVAARHFDTSGLASPAREVGVTPGAVVAGAVWLTGTGVPDDSLGKDGDYYLRTGTAQIYRKVSGAWVLQADLSGADAARIHTGPAAPGDELGRDGDWYFRTGTDAAEFYRKSGGSWTLVFDLDEAEDGTIWHAGATYPAGDLGQVGDFYLLTADVTQGGTNYVDGSVFEKTGASAWTFRIDITGPQGVPGVRGLAGYAHSIGRQQRSSTNTPNSIQWNLSGTAGGWDGDRTFVVGGIDAATQALLARIGVGGLVTLYRDPDNWADYTLRAAVTFAGGRATLQLAHDEHAGGQPSAGVLSLHFTPAGEPGDDPPASPTGVTSSISIDNSDANDPESEWSVGLTRGSAGVGARLAAVHRWSDGRVTEFVRIISPTTAAWVNNVFSERVLTRSSRSTGTNGAYLASAECLAILTRVIDGETYLSGPILTVATGAVSATVTRPGTPASLSATVTDSTDPGSVKLVAGASARATSFVFQRRKGSGSWTTIATQASNTYTDSGLTAGSYTYRVYGRNSAGNSTSSRSSSSVTIRAATATTLTVSVSGGGNKAAGASVTLAATVGGTATGTITYDWRTGSSDSLGAGRTLTVTAPSSGSITYTCTVTRGGLTASDSETISVSSTPSSDGVVPDAPTLTGSGGVNRFTFTASAVSGDGTVRYRFWQGNRVLRSWNTSRTYTATGLTAGRYTLRAQAQDVDGNSLLSNAVTVTVTDPAPVSQAPGTPTISGGSVTHSNGNTEVSVTVSEGTGGAGTSLAVEAYGGSGIGWYDIAEDEVVTGSITIEIVAAASRSAAGVWTLRYRVNNHEASTVTLRATVSNDDGSATSANRTFSAS